MNWIAVYYEMVWTYKRGKEEGGRINITKEEILIQPLVSIVMLTYNQDDFIHEMLKDTLK